MGVDTPCFERRRLLSALATAAASQVFWGDPGEQHKVPRRPASAGARRPSQGEHGGVCRKWTALSLVDDGEAEREIARLERELQSFLAEPRLGKTPRRASKEGCEERRGVKSALRAKRAASTPDSSATAAVHSEAVKGRDAEPCTVGRGAMRKVRKSDALRRADSRLQGKEKGDRKSAKSRCTADAWGKLEGDVPAVSRHTTLEGGDGLESKQRE
eukprot:Sspe_Gene.102170::Locus_77007_Transcript_1_1_Confidence_1.000_Length_724::g.102170::m.102170